MEREPIKLPEQEPTMAKPKNKFKPLAIVFIVLTVLFALAAGFFVWQWLDQKSQIETLKNDINEIQAKLDNKTSTKKDIITSPFNITEQEVWDIVNKQNISAISAGDDKKMNRIERVSFGVEDYQIAKVHIRVLKNGQDVQDGVRVFLYRNNPSDTWKYGYYEAAGNPMCSDFGDNVDLAKAAINEFCMKVDGDDNPKSITVYEYLGWEFFYGKYDN